MNGHTSPPETRQVTLSQEEQSARAANLSRFELELEFVQALANPHYLESLAVQGVLNQPAFVNYLNYLTYWLDKDKGYNQFVSNIAIGLFSRKPATMSGHTIGQRPLEVTVCAEITGGSLCLARMPAISALGCLVSDTYPQALHHLALLQQPTFRNSLKDPLLKMRLHEEQYLHWNTWRMENELPSTSNGTTVPPPPPEAAAPEAPRRRGTKPRTPGTRTPRTPRTPGSAVRTPAPGAFGGRTPRGASGLSISISASDLAGEPGTPAGGPTPGVGIDTPLSAAPWTRPVVSPLVMGLVAGEAGGGSGAAAAAAALGGGGGGGAAPAELSAPPPPPPPPPDFKPVVNGNGVVPHAS